MTLPTAPFDSSRYVGTVIHVEPALVRLNLPYGSVPVSSSYSGYRIGKGEVGEFVLIEGESLAILGRITQVRLPEGERLAVEPTREVEKKNSNPVGIVQLLLSIELSTGKTIRGVPTYPRISQYAYAAHPDLIKHAIEDKSDTEGKFVNLAHVPDS